MIFRLPDYCDEDILLDYVSEHKYNGELSISASLGLTSSDYSEWVKKIRSNAINGDTEWGKSLLYLCFDDTKMGKLELIGLLSIRYQLQEELRLKFGDIGYGVRPSKRGLGYGTQMLKYAIDECKNKGMNEVILGCYSDNLASIGTIKKNGGIIFSENNNYKDNKMSQYYRINI